MGLRTIEGVALAPGDIQRMQSNPRFAELQKAGYSVLEDDRLRLTDAGFLLADSLGLELERILDDSEDAAA